MDHNKTIKIGFVCFILCVLGLHLIPLVAGAEKIPVNNTNSTVIPTGTELNKNVSTKETASEKKTDQAFRVGPTVRVRPLSSEINKSADGLVEVFLDNPTLNDVPLEVDMTVDVPSNIYIYAQDGGMAGGAGAVTGHFSVPPGSARTINLHVTGQKVGTYPIHFSGIYWPDNNKDKWNSIGLDSSFDVKEPSSSQSQPGPTTKLPEIGFAGLVLILTVAFLMRRK